MPHKDPEARRAYARANYAANRERIRERDRQRNTQWKRIKRAANLDEYLTYSRSYTESNRDRINTNYRVWHAANRVRINARRRRRYADNRELRERILERRRQWCSVNQQTRWDQNAKRRAVQRGNFDNRRIATNELLGLLNRQRDRCYYCDCVLDPPTNEHVVPVGRGGRHAIGNLVLVCGRCNSSKCDLTLMEWKRREGWLRQIPPFVGGRAS